MSYNISPSLDWDDYVSIGSVRDCRHCHKPIVLVCDIEGLWLDREDLACPDVCEGHEDGLMRSHRPIYKEVQA